ncbi:MAG TPA: NAD(P)/FAD-dependent oxidoreductase [Pyrinomonadaceae bacterium]|jgi:geranylgeranyl reductase family protein|nr:NAD(P)/FAD-dependent oxidoreductase [Pyrinomonadaceae bacterium]
MKCFDVIIVGAGPAGSFAAERLARAGVSVAIFDGSLAGEPKACGGGVTSKALKAWPHLLEAVGRTIDELDLYSPSGKHLHLKLEEPFAVYSRIAFDTFLRKRARHAGAVVIDDKISGRGFERMRDDDPDTANRWIVKTQTGAEFSCKYLVGADGANSGIAKRLAGPLPPAEMEVAFGYRAPLPESGEAATVVAFLPKWVGYAWAFPRIDHVSFGIATTQDAFDHEALDKLMWDFMSSYYEVAQVGNLRKMRLWHRSKDESQIKTLRDKAERYAARIPGLAPRTWDTRNACGDNWALLGDAAGFADPVTGEGIYYALRSAELFADAYLKGTPEAYEKLWRKDFGAELKRASEMRRRFYGNFWGAPFTDRMIKFARGHRGIRKVLGRLVAGDQGYVDLKKKLARSALKPL